MPPIASTQRVDRKDHVADVLVNLLKLFQADPLIAVFEYWEIEKVLQHSSALHHCVYKSQREWRLQVQKGDEKSK